MHAAVVEALTFRNDPKLSLTSPSQPVLAKEKVMTAAAA
jgi:hypothetical protein